MIIEFINRDINFINSMNVSNMNGDTILHIMLQDINIDTLYTMHIVILEKLLQHTNINTMNNKMETPLYLLVINKLYKIDEIKKILVDGNIILNLFITNKENKNILDIVEKKDYNMFIEMAILSYYNVLQNSKNKETKKYNSIGKINGLYRSITTIFKFLWS